MNALAAKNTCERCGTCCIKGGPALHFEDLQLLKNKNLNIDHLITIRQGEPILSLTHSQTNSARSEIIKIKGRGAGWTCLFFKEKNNACGIYEHRPMECSLLKCWDTAELEEVAGKNLLNRYDIISSHATVIPFIKDHEKRCSLAELESLLCAMKDKSSQQEAITRLTDLVNTDLAIRSQAYAKFHFSLDAELFYFGRPLFKILNQFGIKTPEKKGKLELIAP